MSVSEHHEQALRKNVEAKLELKQSKILGRYPQPQYTDQASAIADVISYTLIDDRLNEKVTKLESWQQMAQRLADQGKVLVQTAGENVYLFNKGQTLMNLGYSALQNRNF